MSILYAELEHQENRDPETEPYRELWAAVLELAISDLAGGGESERRRQALDWILAPANEVGSFKFCCSCLQLDPSAAQARILRSDQARTAGEKKVIALPLPRRILRAKKRPAAAIAPPAPEVQTSVNPSSTVREIKPKARPTTMANNGNGHGHGDLETLKATAQRLGAELAAAEAVVSRLKPVCMHLNNAVAALEGQKPAPIAKTAATRAQPPRQVFPAVPKRPPYEKIALVEALKAELRKSPEPMHHDDLTRAIFDAEPEQLWRAKQCVTATLTHNVKKGYWTRLPDGRYALGAGEGIEPRLSAAR